MEKENLFAVIPHKVLSDNSLTALERLIFAEVMALTNKEGYCWASNQYIAELFNVSKRTISTSMKQLKTKGYVDIEIHDNYLRKVYICSDISMGIEKNFKGGRSKGIGGMKQTSINKYNYKDKDKNKDKTELKNSILQGRKEIERLNFRTTP